MNYFLGSSFQSELQPKQMVNQDRRRHWIWETMTEIQEGNNGTSQNDVHARHPEVLEPGLKPGQGRASEEGQEGKRQLVKIFR